MTEDIVLSQYPQEGRAKAGSVYACYGNHFIPLKPQDSGLDIKLIRKGWVNAVDGIMPEYDKLAYAAREYAKQNDAITFIHSSQILKSKGLSHLFVKGSSQKTEEEDIIHIDSTDSATDTATEDTMITDDTIATDGTEIDLVVDDNIEVNKKDTSITDITPDEIEVEVVLDNTNVQVQNIKKKNKKSKSKSKK